MIIVTGATGKLGRRTVEHLLERLPAERIGVSVRDPRKAQDLADRGIRVRQGDSTTPPPSRTPSTAPSRCCSSLSTVRARNASPATAPRSTPPSRQESAASSHTSQMGAAHDSLFHALPGPRPDRGPAARQRPAWTSLRNGFYAASALHFLDSARRTGDIALPADGPVAWTGHDDLALAAAAVLTDQGRFEGPTPPLTGPAALDFDTVAEIAAQVTGAPSPAPSSPTMPSASRLWSTALPPPSPTCW